MPLQCRVRDLRYTTSKAYQLHRSSYRTTNVILDGYRAEAEKPDKTPRAERPGAVRFHRLVTVQNAIVCTAGCGSRVKITGEGKPPC